MLHALKYCVMSAQVGFLTHWTHRGLLQSNLMWDYLTCDQPA